MNATDIRVGDVVSIDGRHARVTSEPYWTFHANGWMGWAANVRALDNGERGSFALIRMVPVEREPSPREEREQARLEAAGVVPRRQRKARG